MDKKNLNALDGDSMLQEVLNEKIEVQRRTYKKAIKNAVIRNEHSQESVDKANARSEKSQAKLDALVNGGMEGFLTNETSDEDEECSGTGPRRTYRPSTRWGGDTGN
jgi:hypothetical protein